MRFERLDDERLRVTTSAKLNLFLEVIRKREDGYHELASLFHELAWGDEMEIALRSGGRGEVRFSSDDPQLDADPSNLCVHAARTWLQSSAERSSFDVEMRMEKHLPAGGGIGGGSGDGVAVLRALQRLHGAADRPEDGYDLALALGSDCPYFLWGGLARVSGRGEHVKPERHALLEDPALRYCLVLPGLHVPTGAVFGKFHAIFGGHGDRAEHLDSLLEAVDLEALRGGFWNRLEACAHAVEPKLVELRDGLTRAWKAPFSMSGSGSTYFTLCADEDQARAAARAVESELDGVSTRVVAATPGGSMA